MISKNRLKNKDNKLNRLMEKYEVMYLNGVDKLGNDSIIDQIMIDIYSKKDLVTH